MAEKTKSKAKKKEEVFTGNGEEWINFIGDESEALILSGVLKAVTDADPKKKFNMVKRSRHQYLFCGHPAIDKFDFAPKDSKVVQLKFDDQKFAEGENRPYQVIARKFGLKIPIEEKPFYPGKLPEDKLLHDRISWKENNAAIAPFSLGNKPGMHPMAWQRVVDILAGEGVQVIQVGDERHPYIRGAFSVRGMTNNVQLMALLEKVDVLITPNSFPMHAGILVGTPVVALWGDDNPDIYGYQDAVNLKSEPLPEGKGKGPQPVDEEVPAEMQVADDNGSNEIEMEEPSVKGKGPKRRPPKQPFTINMNPQSIVHAVQKYI